MKILLTNDDGVYSVGIQTAAKYLSEVGYEIFIMAPDHERSCSGHSMTLDRPLRIMDVGRRLLFGDFPAKACDGTPTDCISMAVDVMGFQPDLVVSGINQGPNLGDDLTYSGTACAAMEGLIFGYPAIAISLVNHSRDKIIHNETAAETLLGLLRWTKETPIPDGVMYNVNVPNVPMSELKGVEITRKGVRRYTDKIQVVKSPFREDTYWLGGHIDDDLVEETDVHAVARNFVSVTPIQMDMTCFKTYGEQRGSDAEANLSRLVMDRAK